MGGPHSHSETADGVVHRQLIEGHPDGVAILESAQIRYVNEAFRRIVGRESEDLTGVSVLDLLDADDGKALQDAMRAVMDGTPQAEPLTTRLRRGDGDAVDAEILLYPTQLGENPAAAVVLHDVTQRCMAQDQLLISERSYRQLFESAPEAIYVQDETGVFLDVNQRAVEMYGYEKDFFVGRSPLELAAPGRNDLDAIALLVTEAFEGKTHRFEFWGRRSNGAIFPKEVMVTPGTYFGRPVVVAFSRDITERRALEEGLVHAQKLQAVGRLAGGVAHDFNNILQAITSHVDLALVGLGDAARVHRHLDSIREASDRAGALVRQLLAFARRQVLERERIDLNEVVAGLLGMLRRLVRESITLEHELSTQPLVVSADAGQVEQVLMNLVVNASDAIEEAGRITIRTRSQTADEAFRTTHAWAEADEYAVLDVIDSGPGIAPDVQAALFEPFFTTKEPGEGTGLGLAMVHGIVSQHGGAVEVECGAEGGTTFHTYLPRVAGEATARSRAKRPEPRGATGRGRVLFAEDDAAVRRVVREGLLEAGYEVVAAVEGREALDLFLAAPDDVDLALLDVVMSGADGQEVCRRMRAVRPDLPVLFSTGYDEAVFLEGLPKGPGIRTLLKPYTIGKLLDTLAELARSSSPSE